MMKSPDPLRFLPRMQDIFFLAILAAALLLGRRMLNLDGDLPRHLLMGRYIVVQQNIPSTEVFVYPYLHRPYVTHEWLADVLFFLVESVASLGGLVAVISLLLASTFTLQYYKLSSRLNLRLPVLTIVAWGAIATSINWAVRPHIISMFLLGIWLIWADELRRGGRIPIWWFPALMLVWSNLHGEFIAGILVLLAYMTGWIMDYLYDRTVANPQVGKSLWLAFISSFIGSLFNPGGIRPWISILGFVNNRYMMSRMLEANAPDFQTPEMRILLGLLVFSVFLLAVTRVKLSTGQGLLLAGFSAMSLIAIRNIHLYGVVAPYVLAEALVGVEKIPLVNRLESTLQAVERRISGVGWIVASILFMTMFIFLSRTAQNLYQFEEPSFPTRATSWLKENPQNGNMFNLLDWGGYLAYHLWPSQLTFIDSVADTTGEITRQYETVITLGRGWETVLEKNQVEWIVIARDSPLAHFLEFEEHWQAVYKDETAIVLRK